MTTVQSDVEEIVIGDEIVDTAHEDEMMDFRPFQVVVDFVRRFFAAPVDRHEVAESATFSVDPAA